MSMTAFPELPSEHPRLYLRKSDLPHIKADLSAPEHAAARAYFEAELNEPLTGVLGEVKGARPTNADSHILGIMESYALAYLLYGDAERAKTAIRAMTVYSQMVVHYDYNTQGVHLFTLGLVYDWCYPEMTSEDKEFFFRTAEDIASHMEMGYPAMKQGCVTGHGVEGQLQRDLMAVGIAVADEHPELYEYCCRIFFGMMVDAKKFFYESGMYPQGSHYIAYRMQWEFLATEIFRAVGVPFVFGEKQKDPLYWFLYMRRPDGATFLDGDDSKNNLPMDMYYRGIHRSMFHAAMLFDDPYLLREWEREMPPEDKIFHESGNQTLTVAEFLSFSKPGLKSKPLSDLPLTRYFPFPKGEMIARTGWEDGRDSDTAVVQMKINCIHTANHQHLDGGAFQIYYKGYLATDSGYYQAFRTKDRSLESAGTDYGTPHFINYYQRTVAHNCMTVYDKDAAYFRGQNQVSNDGGQFWKRGGKEAATLSLFTDPNTEYRVGEVIGAGFGPDKKKPFYTYLKGDLTPAYDTRTEHYTREFMFVNIDLQGHPAFLLVHDRMISSDPTYKKTWLLHTLEKPALAENGTLTAKDTREGYSGALTLHPILPTADNREVNFVGGEGYEHFVDGVNYLGKHLDGDHRNEGDGWRTEISPIAAVKDDTMLNLLDIKDADAPELNVIPMQTETHVGALAAGVLVLLNRGDTPCDAIVFENPAECEISVLISGLVPGTYTANGGKVEVGSDGVACFRALPGKIGLHFEN